MKNHGYTFVLSPILIETETPVEIAPNHWLTKATKDQIEQIKPQLASFCPTQTHSLLYEYDIHVESDDAAGNVQYSNIHLPPEKWRYYVLNFNGYNSEIRTIEEAFLIMPNEIRLGFQFAQIDDNIRGFGYYLQQLSTFFSELPHGTKQILPVSADDLKLASETYTALRNLHDEFEHISRAFKRFYDLYSIPQNSELVVIGLFSIIESMLTHAPKLPGSEDSLSHQIRTKIHLVRKRFVRHINQSEFFDEISEDKLWNKLYAYRSKIVHGEHSALTDDLQVLKDKDSVIKFLREITKLLLVTGLREPQLMSDLKRC